MGAARRAVDRVIDPTILAVIAVTAAVVATAALGLAVPSFLQTRHAADEGARAQKRLVLIAPVSCKNYRDQLNRGVITHSDFLLATDGLAVACPSVP